MGGNIACIVAVLFGVDVGWRPLSDGGVEYLIQIEPHMLETLKSGEAIASDIPTKLKDVRAYRITVGTEELPRELPAGPLLEIVPSAEPDLSGPSAAPPPARPPNLRGFSEPSMLSPAPGSQPIVRQQAVVVEAVAVEEATGERVERKSQPAAESPETGDPPDQPEERSKPWLLTLFGLFASLGGNVYLFWVAADFRSRYYAISQQSNGMPKS